VAQKKNECSELAAARATRKFPHLDLNAAVQAIKADAA
jgi:hypothetical protein